MQRALVLVVLWSTPIIAAASSPTGPVRTGSASVSGASTQAFTRENVVLETSDDLKLVGSFYPPRSKKKNAPAPAALLVHDAGANREQLDAIAQRLQKSGFGVLTLDLRGHGESRTDDIDWSTLDERGRASLWQLAPRDLEAAASWLLGQKGIHSTNLSLVGYRAGCALVARHAEQDENVIGMMLLSPKAQDLGFDVERTMHNVNGLPTCIIDQKNDETTRLIADANALTSTPWVEYVPVASKQQTVLDDSKTPSKVSSWLGDIALPKKGR